MRPDAFNTLFGQAVEHHVGGRFAEAVTLYEAVIRLNPNVAGVHCNLAIALQSLSKFGEALQCYDRAIMLQPNYVDAYYNKAVALACLNRLDEAVRNYEQAIALNPNHAQAHSNRGNALRGLKRLEEALRSLDKAVQLGPDRPEAHYNKGNVLQDLGLGSEALQSFDRAIELKPDYAEAFTNRSITLRELKRFEEAHQSANRAVELNPSSAAAHNSIGNVLIDIGRIADALHSFDRAIALKPEFAEAHYNRARALQNLGRPIEALHACEIAIALKPGYPEAHHKKGSVLQELKRLADALQSYDRAIALKPDFAEAHNDRGVTLKDMKRFHDALESYDRAIALNPQLAVPFNNRGNVLRMLGRSGEAVGSYERALMLDPSYVEAHNNKGNALYDLGYLDRALESFERAIALTDDPTETHNNIGNTPDCSERPRDFYRAAERAAGIDPISAGAHLNKGICRLLSGKFEEGWPLYEYRKKKSDPVGFRNYLQPGWSGKERLEGKTLLIHAEQGLGDTIQFCRYALLAQEKGARVVLAVQDETMRLLRSLGPEIDVVGLTATPDAFDTHVALLSMPLAFGTTLSTCPAGVPYLHAEPEKAATWRDRIGNWGFKIGICWQGNKRAETDIGRSFPVRHFEAIAKLPNVRLISLQKNDGVEQLADLPAGMRVETLGEGFDAGPDAFIDTAAVMECLDLVITSDTAVAHLAGALGRPAWVALKYVPDWRWLLDRSDSPWYPTLRLFRQPASGDWPSVFAAMETELVNVASGQLN
jgi:tetratricopeptide (TPR) repeat protein